MVPLIPTGLYERCQIPYFPCRPTSHWSSLILAIFTLIPANTLIPAEIACSRDPLIPDKEDGRYQRYHFSFTNFIFQLDQGFYDLSLLQTIISQPLLTVSRSECPCSGKAISWWNCFTVLSLYICILCEFNISIFAADKINKHLIVCLMENYYTTFPSSGHFWRHFSKAQGPKS